MIYSLPVSLDELKNYDHIHKLKIYCIKLMKLGI